jgi:Tfp pilus assembly protein FimV
LTSAIQEQQTQIEALQKELQVKDQSLAKQEEELKTLKAEVLEIKAYLKLNAEASAK